MKIRTYGRKALLNIRGVCTEVVITVVFAVATLATDLHVRTTSYGQTVQRFLRTDVANFKIKNPFAVV